MKTTQLSMLLATGLSAVFALSVRAQISPPFPSGINLFIEPVYATNVGHYSGALGSYYFASDANVPGEISMNANGWSSAPLNISSALGGIPWLAGGGTVKTIYLGETAGWTDDFGFVNSANPSNHIALVTDIQGQVNIFSGAETYVDYAAGTTLDFFLNSGGPQGEGGLFYAFGSNNEFAGGDITNHIKWKVSDVTTTFLDSNGLLTEGVVKTLLIGFEDMRGGLSANDGDSNDLVMGFQFLPSQLESVPEPATYGILAAAGLLGIAAYRRMKGKRLAEQKSAA